MSPDAGWVDATPRASSTPKHPSLESDAAHETEVGTFNGGPGFDEAASAWLQR